MFYRAGELSVLGLVATALLGMVGSPAARAGEATTRPVVAAYYFPDFHPGDARNTRFRDANWSEWELVKAARPRFAGHEQPKVPAWGYEDESKPGVMAKKIDAAADHGVDAFIFDWYYYDDGPFLQAALEEGFQKAPNKSRMKFALMWANHDWVDIFPATRGVKAKLMYPGRVTPEKLGEICDYVIGHYFKDPSYWRVEGKPYFSIYELNKLVESFGSLEATRAALDQFRAKAVAAGLPGVHLNAVVWGQAILPGEKTPVDPAELVRKLGFDSVTSYVWVHHVGLSHSPRNDYREMERGYLQYWDKAEREMPVPYYPNVTMGWDPSPRTNQEQAWEAGAYTWTPIIDNNTPENFRAALERAKERLMRRPAGQRILTINAWNEWTEGSYLEPDTRTGMGYLQAIRAVFGPVEKGKK